LRAEKDIRLRIDLLEGQSSLIAKMLTRAISEHNEVVFAEYASRLAVSRGRIEELLWVLGEKNTTAGATAVPAAAAAAAAGGGGGQSVLDVRVASKNSEITVSVREVIEKLRRGELRMDELSADTQTMVRKGALEMKNKN
jgi:diaminopimelate epimerase